jgi:hypothetical protein
MQYVIGLKKLGHEVLFLEYSEDYEACYHPDLGMTKDPSYGLEFISKTFKPYDLQKDWCYVDEHQNEYFGWSQTQLNNYISNSDVVFNLSGVTELREDLSKIPVRIFIDTDPLFTQIRNINDSAYRENTERHTHHFTFGENIGTSKSKVPDDGFRWLPTRQPIVPDLWPVIVGSQNGKWTTVMQWDSYKEQNFKDVAYGMKFKTFQLIETLPENSNENFEIALGSETAPREALKKKGWFIQNPLIVARNADDYQKFIQSSKGELTVAKEGYVKSNSGWFSERSAAYLMSGRPVITQSTGFEEIFPTGLGLFSFSSQQEVLEAIKLVNLEYEKHCSNARAIALQYFNAKRVLMDLISKI